MLIRATLIASLFVSLTVLADDTETNRIVFSFDKTNAVDQWQTVNDGVMGGRSEGRVRTNENENLEFFGNLSLANNGGFASVRARGISLDLHDGDSIVMKLKGDGRDYTLNLYTSERRMAFSHRASFPTTKDEWTVVTVPLSKFVATSFGRVVSNAPLKPKQVQGIGVLLGDKKAGPFKLEIESIAIKRVGKLEATVKD